MWVLAAISLVQSKECIVDLETALTSTRDHERSFSQSAESGLNTVQAGSRGNPKTRNPESGITGHCFTNTESKKYPKHS